MKEQLRICSDNNGPSETPKTSLAISEGKLGKRQFLLYILYKEKMARNREKNSTYDSSQRPHPDPVSLL